MLLLHTLGEAIDERRLLCGEYHASPHAWRSDTARLSIRAPLSCVKVCLHLNQFILNVVAVPCPVPGALPQGPISRSADEIYWLRRLSSRGMRKIVGSNVPAT